MLAPEAAAESDTGLVAVLVLLLVVLICPALVFIVCHRRPAIALFLS
jgi:hypothetical protein|tara:strand:- start:1551 stop:1691 length:141 start_codon:yes stop_codon:yes gene_type:complete